MQVIEKVKVVPEGYNGAGMNYDGGNRRDVNGKANAGLTLGIIGTALGGLALFGNRRSTPASILGGAGGRGGRSSRGGMRNRIGYDTYDTYDRPSHKDDKEEKILTMFMSGGYNDGEYHFDEYEAKEVVEQMYHVKDNKKYVGEKYDMNKAHEICERYKEVLPNDVEPCDVYVAINAQYHDYAKLFEEWFGGNIDNKVFESAITFWFKDVDFDGDKVWEYFHMNN